MTSLILPAPASIIELVKYSCNGECLKKGCSCNKNNLLCSPMCKCKDFCKNKPPRTDDYDLSMTNYQVLMKNSENIHVPWCVYHYFMIVLFTITKVSPDWICAVTSRFTKLFYCEGANIAHIQSGDTLSRYSMQFSLISALIWF